MKTLIIKNILFHSTMEKIIADYLATLNIPVSRRYFRKRVASHPDYPSLLSVSDILEQMGIPHGVARIDRENLENLERPYVLHLEKDAGRFILINEENEIGQSEDIPEDWKGIVLKAEQVDELKDSENQRVLSEEKAAQWGIYILLASFLGMAALFLWSSFTWPVMAFLATTVVGTVVGYLLVSKDVGVKYDMVESFCNAGKRTNCDRILQSDEATLFGHISLSDAVLSYFSTQLITAFLLIPVAGEAASLWWTLAAIGVLTLPVVAYSFWLQAVTFKTWCRLCLLVAGVLLIQAGLFGWMAASGVFGFADGSLWTAGGVAGNFLAIGSLVFLIKTRLKEGAEAQQAEVAANRIKYNPSVFTSLLMQQPQADCTPFEQELLIGNPEAAVQITMAASLGCAPCKEGFEKAVQLAEKWPEQVNLSVRFLMQKNKNGAVVNDPGETLFNGWVHQVYGRENQSENTAELIMDWYSSLDQGIFREKYPYEHENGQDKTIRNMIDLHGHWFESEGIDKTPTFFINGYTLPLYYRIEDVKFLIQSLPEQLLPEIQREQKQQKAIVGR